MAFSNPVVSVPHSTFAFPDAFAALCAAVGVDGRAVCVEALPTDWQSHLGLEEAARVRAFGSAERRAAFVAGRIALRGLASEGLGVSPRAVPLRREPSGALTVGGSPLHVSISHSGAWAVASLAEMPHAVDVERIRRVAPRLAERIAEPEEIAALARLLPDPILAVWCAKEAVLKARQSGFRLAAKSLRLTDIAREHFGTVPGAILRATGPDDSDWMVRLISTGEYVLALAS